MIIIAALLACPASVPSLAATDARATSAEKLMEDPALQPFDVSGKDLPLRLFLVRPRGEMPRMDGITIHGNDNGVFLVSGSTAALRALSLLGSTVTPLLDAAEAPLPAEREWKWIMDTDPAITEMVGRVSWEEVQEKIQWLVGFGTRHSLASNHQQVASSLASALESYGLQTRLQSFPYFGKTMWNIEATQTGTRYPDSYVIICGHFDSTSENWQISAPGADDNGSGTAAVLTAAEILSEHDFEYSIRYVLFDTEELGLIGSRYYVSRASRLGLDIVGALNFDMIGYWERGVEKDLEIETNGASRWLATAVINAAELYTDTQYELHIYDDAWWGDHYSFWKAGYAAVNHEESWDWYDPDFNPYYHSTEDVIEHIDPGFTVGNIKVGVAALALVAGYDRPRAVSFDVRPGSCSDPFNPKSRGVVHALVSGSADLDVRDIDTASLRVEGSVSPSRFRIADAPSSHGPEGHPCADMNPDGIDDLGMVLSSAEIAEALGPVDRWDEVPLRLTGRLFDGTRIIGEDIVTIVGNASRASMAPGAGQPVEFALHQNSPNPFNPVTRIGFDVPGPGGEVTLRIYDVSGRPVRTLVHGSSPPGRNTVTWDGTNDAGSPVASGVYFYRLAGPGFARTRKMMLIR